MKNPFARSKTLSHGLVWFGAAISVAEIEAGMQCRGQWLAMLLGHAVGGFLLFATGLIGARAHRSAMETATAAFGRGGARFFAAANVLQLVGWTAFMVAQGAGVALPLQSALGFPALCALLAGLVAAWIFIGRRPATGPGLVALVLLAGLVVWLSADVMRDALASASAATEPASFGTVFEVSVAMPLSWLPLISDYTKDADRPVASSAVSAGVYTLGSCWMYALGALLAGGDVATSLPEAIRGAGLGMAGLLVVLFSTVTTTFLDAYSAGESAHVIDRRASAPVVGVAVCVLGGVLAATGALDRYTDFLYLIASVFAPMAAVQLVDAYVVRRTPARAPSVRAAAWNFIAWAAGFAVYHACLGADSPIQAVIPGAFSFLRGWTSPLGATVSAMVASVLFAIPALGRRSAS